MKGLVLACVLVLHLGSSLVVETCPVQESITPCTCGEIKDGISLHCKGPGNLERILSVIYNLKDSSQNLELVLESLTLPSLPDSVRKASSLRLYDIRVERILNSSSIPWPRINDLVIETSVILEKPWTYFKKTTSLRHLKVSGMVIPKIGSEFKGLPTEIAYLDIRKTQTTSIEPNSMSHLNKLKYLLVVDIPLKNFRRNALPRQMPDLHTFILGNTRIVKLEADFFEGMPKLEVLMLNGNQFTTLEPNLLAPVDKHLTHLLAERNPLICDCNLVWLTKGTWWKGSIKVLATCIDKNSNERKEVTMLDEDEYCS